MIPYINNVPCWKLTLTLVLTHNTPFFKVQDKSLFYLDGIVTACKNPVKGNTRFLEIYREGRISSPKNH